MTRPIDLAGFEARFAGDPDPWDCRDDPREALKRRRALAPFRGLAAPALDVGCGDGAGTRALAARSLRTLGVDGAEAALASARAHGAGMRRLRFARAPLPDGLPQGRWRRILVSEIAYYLRESEIDRLAAALAARLAPGGRLVALHHVTPFDDAATAPARAESLLACGLARRLRPRERAAFGRYRRAVFDRPRGAPSPR